MEVAHRMDLWNLDAQQIINSILNKVYFASLK